MKISQEKFNEIVHHLLYGFAKYCGFTEAETISKMEGFTKQLNQISKEHEKSIQLGQDDQVTEKPF